MISLIHHTKKLRPSPLQQHGNDTVRGAQWNSHHGNRVLGEGDWNPGDKKTRNGAETVVQAGRDGNLNQDKTMGLERPEGSGREQRGIPSEIPVMLSCRQTTCYLPMTFLGYQDLRLDTSVTARCFGKMRCKVSGRNGSSHICRCTVLGLLHVHYLIIIGVLRGTQYQYLKLCSCFSDHKKIQKHSLQNT